MKKIDVNVKRTLDSELTGQLLRVGPIRDELMAYTNRFLQKFHTDNYLLFGALTIHQLCSLSVKGGLGIANLHAQIDRHPPDILVWNDYYGDCDLNLIIKKSHYPHGKTTGEVMAAVSQRIKILLIESINDTRYSTFLKHLKGATINPPLYCCSQTETLAHIIDFVSQTMQLPIQTPTLVAGGQVDVKSIAKIMIEIIPGLVGICGENLQKVFDLVTSTESKDFIVYDDRIENLLFVSPLDKIKSTWVDVDYSFFPYAPGRMDSLGYEVSELAIAQQKARQLNKVDQPYDCFKITNTPFFYTPQDISNNPVDPHQNDPFEPVESYNLSVYANNLIDDFALIRTALRFYGFALTREDVQAAAPGNINYRVDVCQGSVKCEFVDVAIPRITSPEWFYCQNRPYYLEIPQNPPPGSTSFKVCNWDYQVEENLNLLIELGCGLSHSRHKADKRIRRLGETWINCNFQDVFPRIAGGALPAGVAAFDAPASVVTNFTNDYLNLYGLTRLPDWLYNEIFIALSRLKGYADIFNAAAAPTNPQRDTVIESAKEFGETGIREILCMADIVDGPMITELRSLLENGDIKVNWVLASYLLLKASQITDVIWFPTFGIFQVINPVPVNAALNIATSGPALAANDYVAANWYAPTGGPPLTFFTMPAADVVVPGAPNPQIFFEKNLQASRDQLYREIRNRLIRANNQMLRISYGSILNCLLRASADSYLQSVL